jgi:GAF domain-containing protein
MHVPFDPHEDLRLEALADLDAAGCIPHPSLDRITAHAQAHFAVPICLVTLVEAECALVASRQGLNEDQIPRGTAFCSHTILSSAVLVVPDLARDPRFRANPLVAGRAGLRFYAGAPLIYRGELRLGSLCVMDTRPRVLTRGGQAELMMLAEAAVSVIAARALRLPEPDLSAALSG